MNAQLNFIKVSLKMFQQC